MPRLPFLLLLAIALATGGRVPAFGQQSAGANAGGKDNDVDDDVSSAEVVIDGEVLFLVRGVTSHPADRRAQQIEDRIEALARERKVSVNSLTLQDDPRSTWILADGKRVMSVLDEDAAIEGASRETTAELCRERIADAIEAYRHDRTAAFLWSRALYAFAASVLLVLVALSGRRIVRALRGALERRYGPRIESFEGKVLHIVKAEHIWRAAIGALNLAWALAIAIAIYAYLHYVLALFPWTRGLAKQIYSIAIDPLKTIGPGLVGMIPNLVFLIIFTIVIRYALKMVHMFLDGVGAGTVVIRGFDPEWAFPTFRLVRLLLIVFAVVVAYPHIPGSETEAFKGVSLFVGILFSLGSSSLIGNLIAGYSMTYRRAFHVGDRVKIGQETGDVEQIRLLVTHLRTIKNEEVIVPNSSILSSEVINYSSIARQRGLILHTAMGIRYEVPWRQVEAMLLEAAARTQGLRRESAPYVLQTALRDFCVTYELNVFCDKPQTMSRVYTELHRNILDVFNEYGVQIMVPAYESDPESPKIVAKEQWYASPASSPQSGDLAERHDVPGGLSEDNRELTRA